MLDNIQAEINGIKDIVNSLAQRIAKLEGLAGVSAPEPEPEPAPVEFALPKASMTKAEMEAFLATLS